VLLLALSPFHAQAKPRTEPLVPLTPTQAALVDRAIGNEKAMIRRLQKSTPVVQTYIQNMKPDAQLGSIPTSDQYILSRVDFGKGFQAAGYRAKPAGNGLFKGSAAALNSLTKTLGLDTAYEPTGFMDMMFIDPNSFDRQHYDFKFVRNDFLGSVRTQVFDVLPRRKTGSGRFNGRIWIEDEQGAVVRLNGLYSGNEKFERPHYLHFDSWRMNLQPGVWLPAEIYVEESHGNRMEDAADVRARTSFWGYSLKLPARDSENASVQIDGVVDKSDSAQDLSPLEASRAWVSQAEANVIDRLVQAGVLAPPSDFDKVLETVTNNLIIGNNLNLPDQVHCRVLLTTPLESLAVGNTILISKGLIDVLPSEEDLASVLAFQLAHITLGHHVDTRYAFSDRLLFPDQATFERITMNHSANDDSVAAKKAVEYLNKSVYHDRLANAGLFFVQLQERSKDLKALTTPRLGDSLLTSDGSPWMAELTKSAPKIQVDNLQQIAALPLGSHLKVNAWDDRVSQLNAKPAPLVNARDKMPFQVTPIFLRLTRYSEAAAAPGPAAGGDAAVAGPAAPPKPKNAKRADYNLRAVSTPKTGSDGSRSSPSCLSTDA
jgi:hypothetical protein